LFFCFDVGDVDVVVTVTVAADRSELKGDSNYEHEMVLNFRGFKVQTLPCISPQTGEACPQPWLSDAAEAICVAFGRCRSDLQNIFAFSEHS